MYIGKTGNYGELEPIAFTQGIKDILIVAKPQLGMIMEYEFDSLRVRFAIEATTLHAKHQHRNNRAGAQGIPCYLKNHGADLQYPWNALLELGYFRARKVKVWGSGVSQFEAIDALCRELVKEGFQK